MTDMTRTPHFFAKLTPSRVEGVEYEPFPADGEPVYTTHPAFIYDEGLKLALDSYHLTLAVMIWKMKVKDPEATMEGKLVKGRAWLAGEIPISENHWELIKEMRQKWLNDDGLPLDTPIGFQHPDFQSSSDQSDQPDQPKQPAPPLQTAS